ncbi:ABC transporter permease [Paenactinomyces guangxiensis]|uniref:ABC transporter permease n=1 Tax=Paenactinomyces guangxiensis TaxID=1490290 RepID=A0A7W2A8W9_9BACL|nr:ABC transporter permease [Paenactinomyces guangxiensis]MBA4494612.1 ABC transporter permease [Paenactinomyces guangxiensis]MBH8591625.1 ABC transporter permease [Paenactinomyces guangxiensis]
MNRYIIRRLLQMLVTLWVIATLTFIMMHAIPGDPFSSEKKLPEQVLKNMMAHYHLDKPIPVQYVIYMKSLLQLDLGPSIKYDTRTINEILAEGFPVSAQLGAQALIFAIIIGLTLGTIAALYQNRPVDYGAMVLAVLLISIPSFVLAPILQKYFGVEWELLPVATWGDFNSTVLPTVALSAYALATVTRLMRSSMVEVLTNDFIRTARSKGLPPYLVVLRHTVRNAILPVVTILGPLAVNVLTGSFVIEHIFSIPGIGKYFVESISNRDYPLIMGVTLFYSALLISVNFIVDLAYGMIDPRIQLFKKGGK